MNKDNLQIIISALIIIILSSFVWGYDVFGVRTIVTEGMDKFSQDKDVKVECPQNVIPTELDLLDYEGGLWGYEEWGNNRIYYYWHPNWLDDKEMLLYPQTQEGSIDDFSRRYCKKGKEEGQNINYYYCDVGYSKTTKDVSQDGVIGKTEIETYLIKLTLEKKEHLKNIEGLSLDKYYVISSSCLTSQLTQSTY